MFHLWKYKNSVIFRHVHAQMFPRRLSFGDSDALTTRLTRLQPRVPDFLGGPAVGPLGRNSFSWIYTHKTSNASTFTVLLLLVI